MALGSLLRGIGKGLGSALKGAAGGLLRGGVVGAVGGAVGGIIGEVIGGKGREPSRPTLPAPSPAPSYPVPVTPIVPQQPQKPIIPGTGPGGIIPGLPDPGDFLRGVQGFLSGTGLPVPPPVPVQGRDVALPQLAQAIMLKRLVSRQKGDGRAVLEAMLSGSLQGGLVQAPKGVETPRGLRYFSPPGFRTVHVMGNPVSVFKPLARSLGLLPKPQGCYISKAQVRAARKAMSLERKVKSLNKALGLRVPTQRKKTRKRKR